MIALVNVNSIIVLSPSNLFGKIGCTDKSCLTPPHFIEMPVPSWNRSGHVNVCQASCKCVSSGHVNVCLAVM